ncbi:MAG: hypothetical protein K0Q79_3055 [Flavipsychrobacter sp.]|jgi:signal transduction histidine kinase/DNA-binding response OmpR family regulator|nr:hypothetical protein [Flavipsychrobacter sp.]
MKKIHLLLLEDMATDADLIKIVLKRSGLDFQAVVAQNKDEFLNAIGREDFDAILADNSLPQFNAVDALEILKTKKIEIPIILVTGSTSEEFAVKMIKDGVSDYILKDRLQRLPNALISALDKSKLEKEKKKYLDELMANESLLKETARMASFGSWEKDIANNSERWSDEQYSILGYMPGEIKPSFENFLAMVHAEDAAIVRAAFEKTYESTERQQFECRVVDKGGVVKHIAAEMASTIDDSGNITRINGFIKDISKVVEADLKEKKITADLLQRNKDLEQFAYIISHNLRGPVANITGLSQAILDNNLSEDEKEGFIGAISSSIRKLDDVIIDLNNIIHVKSNINENKQPILFSQLVNEVVAGIGAAVQENNVTINYDFEQVPGMQTLKSYMHSIFYNLISNSIKFRRPGVKPVIEIKSYREKDKIGLIFRDNCIGFDVEKKGHYIFGLYKRFHPDYAEGKGMGLFMVKTQVEALGGKISLKSKVNEGSEFRIEFESQNITEQ